MGVGSLVAPTHIGSKRAVQWLEWEDTAFDERDQRTGYGTTLAYECQDRLCTYERDPGWRGDRDACVLATAVDVVVESECSHLPASVTVPSLIMVLTTHV